MSTSRWGNLAGLLQFCLGRHYPSGLWLVINASNLNGWPVLAGSGRYREPAGICYAVNSNRLASKDVPMTVNPLSSEQLRIAAQIDSEVARLLKQGGDEALLVGVHPLMQRFKPLLDTAKPGESDRLCSTYPDFAHFTRLLDSMSQAIAGGTFDDMLGRG